MTRAEAIRHLGAGARLVLTWTSVGPVYAIEPGGEVDSAIALSLIGELRLRPHDDALLPDAAPQTWSTPPPRRTRPRSGLTRWAMA